MIRIKTSMNNDRTWCENIRFKLYKRIFADKQGTIIIEGSW